MKMLLLIKKIYRLLRIIAHVLWGVLLAIYYLDNNRKLSEKEQQIVREWNRRFLKLMNIETRVHGDVHPGNHLMVANHISWKDIVLLNSIYTTRFVAKSEIARWPLVGWLSNKVGTLFVKRGNISDIRRLNEQIAKLMIDGEKVTLFPEGATGEGGEISHLYPGLFQSVIDTQEAAAFESPVGVQPIVIIYKVDEQLSPDIPFTGNTHILENLWSILNYQHITADIYFTPAIDSQNTTRKLLSQQSHQQMQEVLQKKL